MHQKTVRLWAGAVAGLMGASVWAAPHESVVFTGVASHEDDGNAANEQRQHTFTGGYVVGHVRVTGTLSEVEDATYASEACIRVTPPGGVSFVLRPFGEAGFTGSVSVTDVSLRADPSAGVSAGTWSFRFFESLVDSVSGGPDATWDTIQLTLDDEVSQSPGDLPATAAVPQGSGPLTSLSDLLEVAGPAHMYKIQICEPSNFNATTVGGTGVDTQLYLFDEGGFGVAYSDQVGDSNQSTITSQFTSGLAVGNFYIAVSQWDTAALDESGQRLWEDAPWDVERAPDGPGASGAVALWSLDFGDGGPYTIMLTGACFVGATSQCVADLDDGTGTGVQDGAVTIDDLLYYLGAFEAGALSADVDNGTGTGTQDGAVTIDDLLFFLVRFEAGC
jgi:hypothetical protein